MEPAAFLSYVRLDDEHEGGQLSELRRRLAGEVRLQLGRPFPIFQDRNDIAWGQSWQKRIEDAIDASSLLIPVVTPSFFDSPPCRDELTRFLARERTLGRSDLILPLYYVGTPRMDDPAERDSDELATELSRRQVADWRELRFEPFTSPTVRKTLARLASQIRDAVQRSAGNRAPVVPVGPPVPARATSGTSGSHVGDPRPAAPATLVVDPYGRGDHTTIAAAVAAAGPGHLVLIRPGIYLENLVIDKPLELVGDGPLEQIVLQAAGQIAILFQASMGRLANLTIRQLGGRDSWGLEIANGRLEVEGCDISSKGRSALSVYGAADPLVRRNVIHDSRQHGILVVARGHSSFEDNEILRSGFAGIAVSGGGDPTVRRNRISDGRQGGVLVAEGGIGTFEDNEISGNRFSGVETRQGGGPLFRRNRITANLSLGVFIHSGGGGVFEENDLTGNGGGAFQVDGDCLPNVIRRDNLE